MQNVGVEFKMNVHSKRFPVDPLSGQSDLTVPYKNPDLLDLELEM